MIDNIRWLGHGSFLILATQTIYINPWRVVRSAHRADIILVSHDHYDHCSVADVKKLREEHTLILGNERVAAQIAGIDILRPWQSISIERISIKAIPAYSPKGLQHPQEHGGLGFIISTNYYDIYYAGDTKIIPEMERISPDIAILPIDGDDTMTVEEAVQAVDILRPRYVIPSNWGATGEGASSVDMSDFKRLVGGKAKVVIPSSELKFEE